MKFSPNPPLPYATDSGPENLRTPARPERMREANAHELLRLLRTHRPCSRADLVRLSGLTAPTVSAAIGELHRKGLVNFIGEGSSSGGRPPRLLEFNAKCGFVFGVDIGGSNVRIALADLDGTVLGRWNAPLRDRTPDGVTDLIAQGVQQLREQNGLPQKRILEIAAGAPGITDARAGRIISAPNLVAWNDVPLRDLIQEKTGVPTIVDNDVNMAAVGESWCGVARNIRNFVFVAIGTGVGAGIVVDGRLHHGSTWSAGEVGYMLVPGLPPVPLAVNRLGVLESAIGGKGIEQTWAAENSGDVLTATQIFAQAMKGDSQARSLLKEVANHLAVAITNIGLVLDMSLVVLGGGIGSDPVLLEATRQALGRNEFVRPELAISSLGADAQLFGAVWLALQAAEADGFRRRTVKRMTLQHS